MWNHFSVPTVLLLAGAVFGGGSLHAQDMDRDHGRTFSCESTSGQRQYCPSDVTNGVRMVRQLGDTSCVEGYNWGTDEHGVWVDRGCRAEFMVPPRQRPAMPEVTRIEPGTVVPVRTNQYISSARADGRIFTGSVSQDVMGSNGALAIPQGSDVELIVRNAANGDLVLDLESVMINGRRYAVDASANRIDADKKEGVGANERTGKFVGGGAILGGLIGAIAGGGKGAAIGAGVGAAAGAGDEMATRGREVRVPSETLLTFQINQPLIMGVADDGQTEGGNHYHR
jgi:Protein of unknown function (DUF3011)